MQSRIIDQIIKEDTFKYFIDDLNNFIIENKVNLRDGLTNYFDKIKEKNTEESLIYYESIRMLDILKKIFEELEDENEEIFEDQNDILVKLYVKSLEKFVEGIDDPDVLEYVNYIIK